MNATRRANPDFLNGVPELVILRLLGRQAMHGYELVQSIRLESAKTLEFGEGCIYPVLHRLEREGYLRSQRELVAGRSRVVYRVTAAGRRRFAESLSAWERTIQAIRLVLEGGRDAEPLSA